MPTVIPYIPEEITVHLGAPSQVAENVTVSFRDYIKNVASSEIYPTWDEDALYANILAQISYALNRVYTEFYRSQGYNFDITNNTAYDQKYIQGRNIFSNISEIVDEIFDSYLRVMGRVEPLAAKYCNGTTVTCQGLSQWGSEYLARDGLDYVQIIRNYYGDDVEIVTNAPIRGINESYPGYPIRRGDSGVYVQIIQVMLNRISNDYPAIPKVQPIDAIFGENTEAAVRKFQEIFNLTVDGIVGRATWYEMVYLYVGLLRLSELYSEGQTFVGIDLQYPNGLEIGDRGEKVAALQYMLATLSQFDNRIPTVTRDGIYGANTAAAVESFQAIYGLPVTGITDANTWDLIYRVLKNSYDLVLFDSRELNIETVSFPGTVLQIGSTGDGVRTLQEYINTISTVNSNITPVSVTGVYGRATRSAVMQIQGENGLIRTGNVNESTWNTIANEYKNVISSQQTESMQFSGSTLRQGDSDF